MNGIIYNLKNPPPLARRPGALHFRRWLISLLLLLLAGGALVFFTTKRGITALPWQLVMAAIFCGWVALFSIALLMCLIGHIRANGQDRAREVWILQQTTRSRRALQILNAQFITCHPGNLVHVTPLEALMKNQSVIAAQQDRQGNDAIRHTQLASSPTDPVLEIISNALAELLAPVSNTLAELPPATPLKILVACTSSATEDEVKAVITKILTVSGVSNPITFITGQGFAFLEKWLESNIRDKSLLLVIALQVNPPVAENSAEVVTTLLLANRLTQTTISPEVLLHRPDFTTAEELASSMKQAADNVPLQDNIIEHLWLSNLTSEQYQYVMLNFNKYPTAAVKAENIITPDTTIGHGGVASVWLSLAAAAAAAKQLQAPQMVISGDQTKDQMWSALLMPTRLLPENRQ